VLYVLDLIGVAVFAASGALAGSHRGLDLFGIAVLAAVTAIGGGTVRDLLLGRHPVFWIKNPVYLYVILAATAIAVLGASLLSNLETPLLVANAIGLGLFALSGAQIAEQDGHAAIVIVLMGTITGVAGGVIRDILSGVVPVLRRYAKRGGAAPAGDRLLLAIADLRRAPILIPLRASGLLHPHLAPAALRYRVSGEDRASAAGISGLALKLLACAALLSGFVCRVRRRVHLVGVGRKSESLCRGVLGIQGSQIGRRCGVAHHPQCRHQGTCNQSALDQRST